jgi:AcrR family transcriptional regulator
MTREEVARNQRARLYGAMIESTSQRGYRATTVAHLTGLAGVSRRSFYEHFPNKEQCFLATHQSILARQRRRLIDVWRRHRGCASGLQTACATLLEDIAAYPECAHLVLIDSLEIGAAARERMQLVGATFECLVATVLQTDPAPGALAGVSSRAIVGGIREVVAARMLDSREHELVPLAGEVLDWIDGYRAPSSLRLARLEPRARRGAAASARLLEGGSERARALESAVQLILEEGYARISDRLIAARAGISTADFHGQFRDKHECLLAALDEFMREALRRVRGALEGAHSWSEGVDQAMHALSAYLLAHPQLLRLAFIERFAVGPAAVGAVSGSVEQLTALLTADAPPPRRAPTLAREAVMGAISAVVAGHLAGRGRPQQPPSLADQLAYTVLAPFLGARAAVAEIAAARRAK